MKVRRRSQGGLLDYLIPHNPIGKMMDFVDSSRKAATNDLNKLATDARKTAEDLAPKQTEIKITRISPSTQESYLGPKQSSLGAHREQTKPKAHSKVNRAEADEWTRKLNAQHGPYKPSALRRGGAVSLKESVLKHAIPKYPHE